MLESNLEVKELFGSSVEVEVLQPVAQRRAEAQGERRPSLCRHILSGVPLDCDFCQLEVVVPDIRASLQTGAGADSPVRAILQPFATDSVLRELHTQRVRRNLHCKKHHFMGSFKHEANM